MGFGRGRVDLGGFARLTARWALRVRRAGGWGAGGLCWGARGDALLIGCGEVGGEAGKIGGDLGAQMPTIKAGQRASIDDGEQHVAQRRDQAGDGLFRRDEGGWCGWVGHARITAR